jgi:hypothetical protein
VNQILVIPQKHPGQFQSVGKIIRAKERKRGENGDSSPPSLSVIDQDFLKP